MRDGALGIQIQFLLIPCFRLVAASVLHRASPGDLHCCSTGSVLFPKPTILSIAQRNDSVGLRHSPLPQLPYQKVIAPYQRLQLLPAYEFSAL